MLPLTPVTRLQEGVTQMKIFLLPEDRELIKQACQKKGVTMTHLARTLLVSWASGELSEE
jgi:hypothetical protein